MSLSDIYQKIGQGTVDLKLQDGLKDITQTAQLTTNQSHMKESQFPGVVQSLCQLKEIIKASCKS